MAHLTAAVQVNVDLWFDSTEGCGKRCNDTQQLLQGLAHTGELLTKGTWRRLHVTPHFLFSPLDKPCKSQAFCESSCVNRRCASLRPGPRVTFEQDCATCLIVKHACITFRISSDFGVGLRNLPHCETRFTCIGWSLYHSTRCAVPAPSCSHQFGLQTGRRPPLLQAKRKRAGTATGLKARGGATPRGR